MSLKRSEPAPYFMILTLALLFFLSLNFYNEPTAAVTKSNILLISLDTLRADFVGLYGAPEPNTPFLDRLAEDFVWFTDCIVQAPWTLASHMSLMTSQYPNVHNVNIAEASLAAEKVTLAEILSDHGWLTQGLHSNPFLGGQFGFNQGFKDYRMAGMKHGRQATEAVTKWLTESPREAPFFLFLHFNDPHNPYISPDSYYNLFDREYTGAITGGTKDIVKYVRIPMKPEDLNHVRKLYAAEVRYLDAQLNQVFRLLKQLDLYEDMMIVITADHGEEFKEHGMLEHNQTLYDELLRVPLLIKFPARLKIKPRFFHNQVKNIDILPTILDSIEVPVPPESVQGYSLMPLIRGTEEELKVNDLIFSESANTHKVSVRSQSWKYIFDRRTNVEELYNLTLDPAEKTDVKAENPDLTTQLAQMAKDYLIRAQGGWHVRTRNPFTIEATLKTTGRFVGVTPYSAEANDQTILSEDERQLRIRYLPSKGYDRLDGVDFRLTPSDAELSLEAPGVDDPGFAGLLPQIFIGEDHTNPARLPIILSGSQRTVNSEVEFKNLVIINRGKEGQNPGLYIWHTEDPATKVIPAEIDAETRAKLESLGYFR